MPMVTPVAISLYLVLEFLNCAELHNRVFTLRASTRSLIAKFIFFSFILFHFIFRLNN